jgi:hypothetical protein
VIILGLAWQEIAPPGTGSLFRMGSYVVLGLYLLLSLPMAIVHAAGLATSYTWLIPWELISLALLFTLEIIFYVSSRSTAARDAVSGAKVEASLDLLGRLDNILKINKLSPELSAKLTKLCEEVRYFDRHAVVANDNALNQKVTQLEQLFSSAQGDTPQGADSLIEELLALTGVRQREARDSQRGGF